VTGETPTLKAEIHLDQQRIAELVRVAAERERDTWLGLIATPLPGREILKGKILGSIWRMRGVAFLMPALWSVGLLSGSLHPLGFLAAVVLLGVTGVLCCGLVLRRTFARTGLAVLGLGFVCLFVVVRAASFHHVDTLLGGLVLGLRISTLLEVTGPLMILAASVRAARRRAG